MRRNVFSYVAIVQFSSREVLRTYTNDDENVTRHRDGHVRSRAVIALLYVRVRQAWSAQTSVSLLTLGHEVRNEG